MTARKLLLVAATGLFLSACGMMPGADENTANNTTKVTGEDTQTLGTSAAGVEVITSSPDNFSQQLGRYTVYERTDCNRSSERGAAFAASLEKLRARAIGDGADTLRVLGTGALNNRGLCNNDMFQLTGVAFREQTVPQNAANNASGGSADSLTARLEELDSLRTRGLITDSEFQQLREQVLNDAY